MRGLPTELLMTKEEDGASRCVQENSASWPSRTAAVHLGRPFRCVPARTGTDRHSEELPVPAPSDGPRLTY